tara:strand:+ start:192 stop:428 length:237 start_codon:yes stop_codon:yes gene_type:complete
MVTDNSKDKLVFQCCEACDSSKITGRSKGFSLINWLQQLHSVSKPDQMERGAVPSIEQITCPACGSETATALKVTMVW